VSAAPTLGADGTLYVADLSGLFSGVCPNGVARFSLSTIGLESSPAIGPDGTVYFGTDDNQLRAIQPDGIVKWVFSASAPIVAAPVVEVTNGTTAAIYVTDVAGRIFKIDSNGKPVAGFSFTGDDCPGRNPPQVGRISSSPALAGGHLYVGSEDGNLYAVRTDTGCIEWTFPSAGTCASPAATAGRACTTQSECDSAQRAGDGLCERTPIVSSPAVATNGGDRTVVVGSNGGHVYFVPDQENTFGTPVVFTPAESCTGVARAPIRSSPAIGSDGTVYVGADDGRVYAIGAPL